MALIRGGQGRYPKEYYLHEINILVNALYPGTPDWVLQPLKDWPWKALYNVYFNLYYDRYLELDNERGGVWSGQPVRTLSPIDLDEVLRVCKPLKKGG